jgi:hypothetical protein
MAPATAPGGLSDDDIGRMMWRFFDFGARVSRETRPPLVYL